MTDLYGQDLMRLVQDLVRRVEKLEAAATSGRGLKIGRASGSFTLPTASANTPDDGASLYYDGSTLRYVDDGGDDKPVGGLVAATTAPTFPGSFSSPATVTGSVTPANYNALRADVVNEVFTPLREVITIAHNAGWWPAS